MSAAVLYRGLISGYTAPQAAFVGGKRLTKHDSMMDIAAEFPFLKFKSCRIYRSISRQYT